MLETCIREFPGSISDQDIDHQHWGFRCFPQSTQVKANTILGTNAGNVKIFFFLNSVWPWGLTASYSTRTGNSSRGLKRIGREVNHSPPSVQRLTVNISSWRRQGRPSLLPFHIFFKFFITPGKCQKSSSIRSQPLSPSLPIHHSKENVSNTESQIKTAS
jgi:hypothetical protein